MPSRTMIRSMSNQFQGRRRFTCPSWRSLTALLIIVLGSLRPSTWITGKSNDGIVSSGTYGETALTQKVVLVMPMTEDEIPVMGKNMRHWTSLGHACSDGTHEHVDLWLLFNKYLSPEMQTMITRMPALALHRHCFGRIRNIFANLSDIEDTYPAGPSNMFFRIFLHPPTAELAREYDTMFWMEQDVTPVQELWIDKLYAESLVGDFWMKGSIHTGRILDGAVARSSTWNWVGHINGNALYRLNDPKFTEYLRLVVDAEPPNHYWKPFDISIWKVLHDFPYNWRIHQRCIHRFVYSDFIQNWGFTITPDKMKSQINGSTFLVHGKKASAGLVKQQQKLGPAQPTSINWNGAVDIRDDISVVVYTENDTQSAIFAVRSLMVHMPAVLEVLLVVKREDVQLYESLLGQGSLPRHVRLVNGPYTWRDTRETYMRLVADTYCKGKFIMQIDANVALTRKIYRKDLIFMQRPIFEYGLTDTTVNRLLINSTKPATPNGPSRLVVSNTGVRMLPRDVFATFRTHVHTTFNTTIADFARQRPDLQPCVRCMRNERTGGPLAFEIIETYLWDRMHDAVWWQPVGAANKQDNSMVPIIPPYSCRADKITRAAVMTNPGHTRIAISNSGNCEVVR